jgi:hypothetical protein
LQPRHVDCYVVDPAGIPVERHQRCAKTHRLDVIKLVINLHAWPRGERMQGIRVPSPEDEASRQWRIRAIEDIAPIGRGEWKKRGGYHRPSLIENTMCRQKTFMENCLSARCIGSQPTEVAICVATVNYMIKVARPQPVSIS